MLICDLFLTCSKVGHHLSSSHVKPRHPSAHTKRVVWVLRRKCPFAPSEIPPRMFPAAAPAPGSLAPRAPAFGLFKFFADAAALAPGPAGHYCATASQINAGDVICVSSDLNVEKGRQTPFFCPTCSARKKNFFVPARFLGLKIFMRGRNLGPPARRRRACEPVSELESISVEFPGAKNRSIRHISKILA